MTKILPWHWLSLPLENRTGAEIFDLLFRQFPQKKSPIHLATLLESPCQNPENLPSLSRYSICAGSPRIMEGKPQFWTPKLGEILPFLRRLLKKKNNCCESPQLPFTGGWLGWLGYDLAKEIEKLPLLKSDPLPFPVAYWYEPDSFAVLDHEKQTLWLACTNPTDLAKFQGQLESPKKSIVRREKKQGEQQLNSEISFLTSQAEYEAAVLKALKYIQAGDVFQANLSLRFQTTTRADSWTIYRTLQAINPSPFASYWETPMGVVISCSPERLIQLEGRKAQTRPIAGTRARGANLEIDQHLASELLTNVKERAEHIMLVDLERNDLGRVCEWGSVKVDELLTIERYSHVMHLVSNVTGILGKDYDTVDLIRALFPGGTITGCPKVRCMEIIEELEPVRRNLFYGSCGYLDQGGNLDLNILIRTLLFSANYHQGNYHPAIVWGQVGAGIVADSDPEKEWYESLKKAAAQLTALKLAT
ncbi:MAG: anthranilate synthase component I [Gomphosphaeria aponina SAG 52.96 = DSM 107014]|uniref:Anthranilate synthase component 1 n=1 Tax=Gomphosphaeria aponina SAG 52.96 = DSM 107014 TaxID=1521640 RepID=A0A941JS81_9CHRO|nr:anthranilate synthase component I [Gomphosphaeria aponina SAG 52.96 = DSM 107014]